MGVRKDTRRLLLVSRSQSDPSAGYLHLSTLRGDSRADVSNQLAILGLNEYVKFRYNELFQACLEL